MWRAGRRDGALNDCAGYYEYRPYFRLCTYDNGRNNVKRVLLVSSRKNRRPSPCCSRSGHDTVRGGRPVTNRIRRRNTGCLRPAARVSAGRPRPSAPAGARHHVGSARRPGPRRSGDVARPSADLQAATDRPRPLALGNVRAVVPKWPYVAPFPYLASAAIGAAGVDSRRMRPGPRACARAARDAGNLRHSAAVRSAT